MMTNNERPPAGTGTVERQAWLDRRRRRLAAGRPDGRWRRTPIRELSPASARATGWEQRPWSSRLLHRVGEAAGSAVAGIVAASLVVAWAVVGFVAGFPGWWQTTLYSVTGSITFVMVFVIHHKQERQTFGTQRKLDELIRSSAHADDTLIAVEEAGDEDLRALTDLNLADRDHATGQAAAHDRKQDPAGCAATP